MPGADSRLCLSAETSSAHTLVHLALDLGNLPFLTSTTGDLTPPVAVLNWADIIVQEAVSCRG